MKCIGWPVAEIWPIQNSKYHEGCICDPHFTGRGGRKELLIVGAYHSKERCWFAIGSQLLPIIGNCHCAISDHSATICYRMSATLKSIGDGSLWVKILGCFLWSRSVMLLGSAESEHSRLTNPDIIFEECQPICDHAAAISQRHGETEAVRTDERTDDSS